MSDEHRGAGRPTKKTEEAVRVILEELRNGALDKYASYSVGITPQTFIDWKNEDENFNNQVRIAKACGVRRLQRLAEEQNNAWKVLKNVAKGDFTDEETVNVNDTKAPDLSQIPDEEMIACLRGNKTKS